MAHRLKPLAEQVIVITGASSGIGLCTARMAARRGASVVLAARSKEVLEEVVHELSVSGAKALACGADVADRRQVEEVAARAIAEFGRIDTWVNDAGVSIYARLDEVSEADGRRLFDTNFWGVFNGSLAALPHLKRQGGSLINVGSEVSDAVVPLQGIYSASKHAVKGFTDALRVEIEIIDKAPVSITLIQPTAVDTPYPGNARNYMDQEPKLPDPMIEPEKVAEAILAAAVEGGRDVKVGAMSILNTAIAKIAPSLGDKMSAKQADRQQKPEAPHNPEGALYNASGSGQVRGEGKTG
ncbi:SDR family oxidoreductase [Variovorax sp. UMC13]|uniref:SDR family oxidoreductase n=1 Tax=Variovorax sp. UMC13 TaxID=1862326 RepID=UPI0016037BF1|nr:SDR family oxidoreductase [Variovorax sp. UMC13]MBB1600431.1 short-chain dehydrogenase [Variovorax sp. UMC13]